MAFGSNSNFSYRQFLRTQTLFISAMDELEDAAPSSFSIHITEQKPSSSSKKSLKRSSSHGKLQVSNAVNKKRKTTTPLQDDLSAITPSSTGQTASNPSKASSFRHLFSFGAGQAPVLTPPGTHLIDGQQQTQGKTKKKKKKKSKPFTFFSAPTNPHPSGDLSFLPKVVLEPTREAHPSTEDMDTRPGGEGLADNITSVNVGASLGTNADATADADLNVDLDNVRDAASESSSEDGADRFDASDDAVMQMALSFCRRTTLNDVNDEWNAVGGVFDQMKRDFRLKRSAVLRGRKLGTS